MQLRLSPEQNDEKREAEQAVKEVEDELQAETDESKQEGLKAEVATRKEKLSTLIDGFQVSTLAENDCPHDDLLYEWFHCCLLPDIVCFHTMCNCRKWQLRKLKLVEACGPLSAVLSRWRGRALVGMVSSPMEQAMKGVVEAVEAMETGTTATLELGRSQQQAATKQLDSMGARLTQP